ncbi:MAG: type II toxin-antitoxin system VapC family toxin [Novosphingobium sp.]
MKFMLDANSIINLLSGSFPALNQRVAETETGAIVTSAIAFAEVALGCQNGKPPELRLLASLIEEIPMLAFDAAAADAYAKLPFKRANYDRLIAAQALSLGLVVITRNTKDFADVPGLVVENWTV